MVNQDAEWPGSPCRCSQVAGATEQYGESLARHRHDTPLSPSFSLSPQLKWLTTAVKMKKIMGWV